MWCSLVSYELKLTWGLLAGAEQQKHTQNGYFVVPCSDTAAQEPYATTVIACLAGPWNCTLGSFVNYSKLFVIFDWYMHVFPFCDRTILLF